MAIIIKKGLSRKVLVVQWDDDEKKKWLTKMQRATGGLTKWKKKDYGPVNPFLIKGTFQENKGKKMYKKLLYNAVRVCNKGIISSTSTSGLSTAPTKSTSVSDTSFDL